MDEDLLRIGDEQAPASETTTTENKQQEDKPKRDHWSFRVNFSDPAPLVPGFNSNRFVGLDPFTPWVGKDPVVVGPEPSANANAYVPIDPLQSFSAGQTQAINVLGRPFTRDQLYSMPGGRTLMRFTDKLNRGTSRGFMDAVTEVTPWTFIPFFNTVGEIGGSLYNAKRAGETFEKLQRGDAISNEEAVLAQAYMAESTWRAHNTTMGTVGDIAITMPALCVGYGASAKVVQSATNRLIKALPERYAKRVALDAATKMTARQTTNALQKAIRTIATAGGTTDKAAMDTARQTIATFAPRFNKALSLAEKSIKTDGEAVNTFLSNYIKDGTLTPLGKIVVKNAAKRQALRGVVGRAAEEATTSKVSAGISKSIYLGKYKEAVDTFTKLADNTQNKAIKSIYTKAADDILAMIDTADSAGMQKIAGDALSKASKYTANNTMLRTSVFDYVDNYVNKATAIGESSKFRQWWLETANLYKDAAIRGLTEHGTSIIDTLPMSWQGHLAQAIATMTVDAPIKGLAYTLLGRAVRMPITTLWTAISPSEDGIIISPVTQQELAIKYAALESDDDQMMNNAWWMALGAEWVENASESTGEAFSHLGKGLLGASKGGRDVAMRLAKQAAPNLVDNAVNRMRAVGTVMHDRIKSMCGDTVSNAAQVERLKQQAIRRVLRNPVMMERTFGKGSAGLTFEQVWNVAGKRAAAVKAARKLMSHKALFATAVSDKLIRLGDVLHSNLLSPSGISRFFKSVQWDGIIGESLEERYGDFVNALFGNDAQAYMDKEDDGVFGRRSILRAIKDAASAIVPEWDQMKAELIAFSIPGAANHVALRAQTALGTGSLSRFNRLMEERQYFYNKAQAVIDGGGEAAYKEAVKRFQEEVAGPEEAKNAGDKGLDFDALSAAGRFAVGDNAAGVTLQETDEERLQGANTQAPASKAEIDEWIDDFVDAAKDYSKIINDISFNTNMSMTAKVLHKVIGAINFGITGNYAMLRYDPMLAMTQMCINGDRLLLTAAGAAKAAFSKAVEDVMQTAPDELKDRLSAKGIIADGPVGSGQRQDINQAELLREVSQYNEETKRRFEDVYNRYAREEISKIAKASFAMEGTLRVSMNGDIAAAAARLADARLQPHMAEINKGNKVMVSYVDPAGNATSIDVNKATLEDARNKMIEADKVNLAFRYFSIAHDGSIKYKQAENHGLNRAAQIILTLNGGKYSENQDIAVYQHQLDSAIAMMAMGSGSGRVSVAANIDTLDTNVMDEMKKFGMPLDMSDVDLAATLDGSSFTLTDAPVDEQMESTPALRSLVKMMTAMGALHMDNAEAIRGIYREGIRLAKMLHEHLSVRKSDRERTFIMRDDSGITHGIEVGVLPDVDGKKRRSVTFYDKQTKKLETAVFEAREETGEDGSKYTEFYAVGKDGNDTMTSVLTAAGYRLTNRTVLFTPASRMAITDPLVGVWKFANLRSKFLNDEGIKNGKFGQLLLGTSKNPGYFNVFESMDMLRAARDISAQYMKDSSKEEYASEVQERDENNNPTGVPKLKVNGAIARDISNALAVAEKVANDIIRNAAAWSEEFGRDSNGAYLVSVGAASDAENIVIPFDPGRFSSPSAAVVNEIISNRIMSRLDAMGQGTALSDGNIKLFRLDKIMSSLLDTAKKLSDEIKNNREKDKSISAESQTIKASIDELIETTLAGGVPTRAAICQFITNVMFGYGNWARKNGNYISNQGAWGRIAEDWIENNSNNNSNLYTYAQIYTAWLFGGNLSANSIVTAKAITGAMDAYGEALGVYGADGTLEWLSGIKFKEASLSGLEMPAEEGVAEGGNEEGSEEEGGEEVGDEATIRALEVAKKEAGDKVAAYEATRPNAGPEPVKPEPLPKRLVKLTVKRDGSPQSAGQAIANVIQELENAGLKMTLENLMNEMDNTYRADAKGGNVQGSDTGAGATKADPPAMFDMGDAVDTLPNVKVDSVSNFKNLSPAAAVAVARLIKARAEISEGITLAGNKGEYYKELCREKNGYVGTAFDKADMDLLTAIDTISGIVEESARKIKDLQTKIDNAKRNLKSIDKKNKEAKREARKVLGGLRVELKTAEEIAVGTVGQVSLPEGVKYSQGDIQKALEDALIISPSTNAQGDEANEDTEVEDADQVTDSGNDSWQSDTIYQLNKSDQWQAVKFVMGALFPETNGNVAAACERLASGVAMGASPLTDIILGGPKEASKYIWKQGEESAPNLVGTNNNATPMVRFLGGLFSSFTRQSFNKAIETMSTIVQLSGVSLSRTRTGDFIVNSDNARATQPHMALRMRVAAELIDWMNGLGKDKSGNKIDPVTAFDKLITDIRKANKTEKVNAVKVALSQMSKTLGRAIDTVGPRYEASIVPDDTKETGKLRLVAKGQKKPANALDNLLDDKAGNYAQRYVINEVKDILRSIQLVGFNGLSTAGLLLTAMGKTDITSVSETTETASIGSIGVLLSEYTMTFRLGRKTESGKTTELNKGAVAIAQRGLVSQLVEMLDGKHHDGEQLAGKQLDPEEISRRKRFCVLGDNHTPIFTHITSDRVRAVDIIPAMVRLIYNGGSALSNDTLIQFPTYTGDRRTLTTVQFTFGQMLELASKLKIHGPGVDGKTNKDFGNNITGAIRKLYLDIARWINEQCKLDQIEPKRTQVVSSEQVPIPLARWDAGSEKYIAPKVAVYISSGSTSNETWLGTGYFFSPDKEKGVLHAFEPDGANTTKVHIVSVNNTTGRLEMIKGDFVLNRDNDNNVKYSSSAMRKISKFGNDLASADKANVIMTDFDGVKVGPLAFDSAKIPGIKILVNGAETRGKLGDIIRGLLFDENHKLVKNAEEVLDSITVVIGEKSYSLGGDEGVMPGLSVKSLGEGSDDIVLTYDAMNMEALMAANLYHESTLSRDKMTANNATDVMTGLYRAVNAKEAKGKAWVEEANQLLTALTDYSDLAGAAFTEEERVKIIGADPDLLARYRRCKTAPDVQRDIALTLGSALLKRLTPKVFRTKVVLMSTYAKEYAGGTLDSSLRDADDAFYTKNEDANGVGYIRANINNDYVRYGCFYEADDTESAKALGDAQALWKALGKEGNLTDRTGYLGAIDALIWMDSVTQSVRARKENEADDVKAMRERVYNVKLGLLGLFNSAYDGKALGEESLYSLWADLKGAEDELLSGESITATHYSDGKTEIGTKAVYIPGSLVTFPRSPSYNLGPVFTSLRLSTAVSYDKYGNPSRDAAAMAAPSAMRRLGADHDGDTAFLMFPFAFAPYGDTTVVKIAEAGMLGTEGLTDAQKYAIRVLILSGYDAAIEDFPELAVQMDEVIQRGFVDKDGNGKCTLGKQYVALAGANMIRAFNLLSTHRSDWLTEGEWSVGAVGVKDFDNEGGLASMFGSKPRDMLDPEHVTSIMDSARGASVARGAAVAQVAALHKAFEFGFFPIVTGQGPGSIPSPNRDKFIGRAEKIIRILDGYANALFDDLKEQLSFRMRLTPETMDAVIGSLVMWAATEEKVDITPENAVQFLADKYITAIDGESRIAFSGDLGVNMLYALHSNWTQGEAESELKRLGNTVDKAKGALIKTIYEKSKDVKPEAIQVALGGILGLKDVDKESNKPIYTSDRGAVSAMARSPLIKSLVVNRTETGDRLIAGAYFMALTNKFAAAVNPYKASIRSERSRTAAHTELGAATPEKGSTLSTVSVVRYDKNGNSTLLPVFGTIDSSSRDRLVAANRAVRAMASIPNANNVDGDETLYELQKITDKVINDLGAEEASVDDAAPIEDAGDLADYGPIDSTWIVYDDDDGGPVEDAGVVVETGGPTEGAGVATSQPAPSVGTSEAQRLIGEAGGSSGKGGKKIRFGKQDIETVQQAIWAAVASNAYQKAVGGAEKMLVLNDKFIEIGDLGGKARTDAEKWLIGVEVAFATLWNNLNVKLAWVKERQKEYDKKDAAVKDATVSEALDKTIKSIGKLRNVMSMFNRPNFNGRGYMRIHTSAPDAGPHDIAEVSAAIGSILDNNWAEFYQNGKVTMPVIKNPLQQDKVTYEGIPTGAVISVVDAIASANQLRGVYTPSDGVKPAERDVDGVDGTISIRDIMAAMIQYSAMTSRTRTRSDIGSGSFLSLLDQATWDGNEMNNEDAWKLASGAVSDEVASLAGQEGDVKLSDYVNGINAIATSQKEAPKNILASIMPKSVMMAVLSKQVLRKGKNGGTSSFVNIYIPRSKGTGKTGAVIGGSQTGALGPTVVSTSPGGYKISDLTTKISAEGGRAVKDMLNRIFFNEVGFPLEDYKQVGEAKLTKSQTVVANTVAVAFRDADNNVRGLPVILFTYMSDIEKDECRSEAFIITGQEGDRVFGKRVNHRDVVNELLRLSTDKEFAKTGKPATPTNNEDEYETVEVDLNSSDPLSTAIKDALEAYKKTPEGAEQFKLSASEKRAHTRAENQYNKKHDEREAKRKNGGFSDEDAKRAFETELSRLKAELENAEKAYNAAVALAANNQKVDEKRKELGASLMAAALNNLNKADEAINGNIGTRLDEMDDEGRKKAYYNSLYAQAGVIERSDRSTYEGRKAADAKAEAKKELVRLLCAMLGTNHLASANITDEKLDDFITRVAITRMKVNLYRAVANEFMPGTVNDKKGDMIRKTYASYHDIVSGALQMMAGNGYLLFNDINNKVARLYKLLDGVMEAHSLNNGGNKKKAVGASAVAAYMTAVLNTYLKGDRYNLSTVGQGDSEDWKNITSINTMLLFRQLNPSNDRITGIAREGTYKIGEKGEKVKAEDAAIGMRNRTVLQNFIDKWLSEVVDKKDLDGETSTSFAKKLTEAIYARAKASEETVKTEREEYDNLLTSFPALKEAINLFGDILYRTQSALSAAHFTDLRVRNISKYAEDANANVAPIPDTAVAEITKMREELTSKYLRSEGPQSKLNNPAAAVVIGPIYNEFMEDAPTDEISDSVLLLDPAMAFKHYSLPTYGGYNLRDSVKFGSGQEVIAEGMEVSRHFEMMYGLSDVAGRICPVRVVDDAEEVVFEKGAFVVKGKNGKRIVFDSPERAMLPGKWVFHADSMMLTEDEKDMARLLSRARMAEAVGGSDRLYTGIGNAAGGAAIGLNHTDFGRVDKLGGIDLYTKEEFFKMWSRASVLQRHQRSLRGETQVSALFYWLQGVYSRVPDVILDQLNLEQTILDALWRAGQIVFGENTRNWNPRVYKSSDRAASQQLTDVFLSDMVRSGLVAVSDRKDEQGRRITSLTLPIEDINKCFEKSSLYQKLKAAGRTDEMLSAKYAKEAVAPVLKKLSDFIHANPDVAMGDIAGFTGFGENFWLCGNGLLSSSAAVKARWSGKRTAIMTEAEEAAAASFATTLHYKRTVPLFEYDKIDEKFKLNGYRVGRGIIEMYNDMVAGRRQSDGKTYGDIKFMMDEEYTQEDIEKLGLSARTTVGDLAALIYRATVERKYEGSLPRENFGKWSKEGLGVTTFDAFIKAYENSDVGMSTSIAAPTYGMTMDSAFKLEASLPTDAGLGAMLNRLCLAVADCCAYTGTLHSLATTVSYEGLPNYIIEPTETKEHGEIFDDRMYGELAMWYDRVFKLGLGYDGAKNGRTNLRLVVKAVREKKLGKKVFSNKYIALEDDPKAPGSGSFTGVERVYCFVPNSEDAQGRVKMDDSHSKLTELGAKDSEAYGYMKKLCWIKAGVYNNRNSIIRALDNIHSFSKASNVWGSLFFTIATKFESPVAASGLLNTIIGQFESGSDWMHNLKPGKETDLMSNFGSVVDSMMFGGSKPSEWGIGGGMLTYRDIIKMMDSNDPALIQLRKLCADVGVTMSYPNDSTVLDENSKNFSRAIDKMSEQFAKWVSLANPEMKGRAKDYATGFFRGLATDQRERAFTYVMNATKMAVVAQICAKMRNIAVMNGMYFDPVVELRKVGNYINEEVGGIDPLAHAFDTPAMRRMMNRLLFSWQWTMGSWSAGGGTVLTNALLGGNATTPMMRGNIIGRWLRMYGWIMYGVPFFAQNVINAFSKGVFMLCGDDPNRYEWLFKNNEEKNQNAFDITPLLTAMAALDKKFLGSTLYNAKTGAYGSVIKGVSSIVPMYTGTGDNVTGRRHKYMHFAKQGEEVGRWFTDPGGQLWAKFSSPVRWALESTFGYNYAGYEVSWRAARETPLQSALSPNGAVFRGALSCLLPFSMSSLMNGGEAGALTAVGPVTNSISKYSGSKKLERELREYIKTAGLTRGKPLFRRHKAKIEQTLKDLELNGYPVEAILAGARGKVAGDLYNQLFAALPPTVNSYYDAKRVNDIARQLRALGVKPGGPLASIKGKFAMRSRNVTRDPAYQRAKGIVEGLFDSDLSAYYGRDVRQAMKGGYSQVFGDNVPKTIFGAPVAVGDGGYFEKNPASGGYFTPGNKKLPESVFGVPVMTGDSTGIDKRPYMRLPSNLPKSVFGAPVVARNRSWGDRRRAEDSFYDTRKFLAQDDTPNKIFGIPVNWQDHPLFAERPSIPGFYETGSEAQRAMKRRDVKSVFGVPVSWDGDDDDPDDPPPGGGLPVQAADEGGNVSDSPYVDDYEYGVNLALGHADDNYAYAGYTDKEIDDLVSRENKNANVAIGKDDEVFRTPTSALAGREDEFIEWARRNMTESERREGYGRDYDYVGAFLAGEGRDKYGNGHLTDDFKLPNHPSFNPEAIMGRFRREGREDDGIEYIRNALSKERGVNPKQWVARSQSPKDLVTFKGFEDDRYKENDYAIRRAVYLINKNPEKYIGLTKGQLAEWRERYPNGIPADLLKSVMITETGGRDKKSREAFAVDPFQVNVVGDWDDAKASLGLRNPTANNEGDKLTNVMAAIIFLLRKGYGKSGIAPKDAMRDKREATYDGIEEAIRRYHGTSQEGVDRYVNKTMNRYLFPYDEMIQPGKGAQGDPGTY